MLVFHLLSLKIFFRYPKDWTLPTGSTFSVFGWGHNHRGQLGGIEGNKVKSPRLCESLSELNPAMITGGEQTLFAVTDDGKVSQTLLFCHLLCVLSVSHYDKYFSQF